MENKEISAFNLANGWFGETIGKNERRQEAQIWISFYSLWSLQEIQGELFIAVWSDPYAKRLELRKKL